MYDVLRVGSNGHVRIAEIDETLAVACLGDQVGTYRDEGRVNAQQEVLDDGLS